MGMTKKRAVELAKQVEEGTYAYPSDYGVELRQARDTIWRSVMTFEDVAFNLILGVGISAYEQGYVNS